jgi:hypothetical protein
MTIFGHVKENMKSRVKGDFHARFCGKAGVKFPCLTRLAVIFLPKQNSMTKVISYISVFLFLTCNSIFAQSIEQATYETEEYKIIFPGQFEKSSQNLESKLGLLLMTIISYEPKSIVKDSNYVYMIMETKYPDSTIHSDKKEMHDKIFTASINGAVKNVNGKLIKEIKGLTGIYPNRTIEIDYQNGLAIIKMTMILWKSKVIVIQTITNTQNYPNSTATNFLNSFGLK